MRWFKRKEVEPPAIAHLSAVDFGPNDTLVVMFERRVPHEVFDRLRNQMRNQGWGDRRILVFEGGVKLGVLHDTQSDSATVS